MSVQRDYLVGYCTNIHAGTNFDSLVTNLREYAIPIQQSVCEDEPLGVGLWLSHCAALEATTRIDELLGFLADHRLLPFTFNAFPFGDFHQAVVKHAVYKPDWSSPERLEYTRLIARVAHELRPDRQVLSISTLPIGWPDDDVELVKTASVGQLRTMAYELSELEEHSGRRVILSLEPEPGCILQTSSDVVSFMHDLLLDKCSADERLAIKRHIGVCHDICHAAVMFEEQSAALENYKNAEICIGKIQVSAAIGGVVNHESQEQLIADLSPFAEARYLHQTTVRHDGTTTFFEDLPAAIESFPQLGGGEFRSHFHVPIYSERFGLIEATGASIDECLQQLDRVDFTGHLEVETYAWQVAPAQVRRMTISENIARELEWLHQRLANLR